MVQVLLAVFNDKRMERKSYQADVESSRQVALAKLTKFRPVRLFLEEYNNPNLLYLICRVTPQLLPHDICFTVDRDNNGYVYKSAPRSRATTSSSKTSTLLT